MAIETPPLLLERQRELAELGSALTEARQGRGQVVLIEASAGLGKTSLLRVACQTAAAAGFTCLRARASELERDFAFGCVRQLLEPAIARTSDANRNRLFEGAAALSKPLFAPTGAPQPSLWDDSSFRMLHGLYWLLSNLADEGPVALSVDDLHWSDTESLRFFNYLAPRLDGLPLALLASTRSGEQVTVDLARLATGPETTRLRPEPLSIEATAMLCERRLGRKVAHNFAAACHDATGGNPFFLEALLREAKEQNLSTDAGDAAHVRRIGPTAVAESLLLRLSGAPAAGGAVVRAVAVLGDGASLTEVAGLAELAGEEVARTADVLVALAILRPGEGLEFVHPIVREAVYANIGPRERGKVHARAAGILAASGASEERIAAQFAHAPPAGDPERVELLRRVAAAALQRGAPAAAAAWLRRALVEPPPPAARAAVLLELGAAELRVAAPGAVDHLAAAVDLLREPRLLASSVRWLASALTMSGAADRAVEATESAIEVVETEDRELALLLEAELVSHAQEASLETRTAAASRLERYGDLDGATPGERLVLAVVNFQRARASESATVAVGFLERGLANGLLLATDALDLADACLEQALVDAHARSSIPAIAFVIEFRGWVSLRRGDVAQAEADARMALDLLTAHDIQLGTAFALALLIEALTEQGETAAAEQALRDSGLGETILPGLATNDLLEARGLLRLAQGRLREGVDDLLEFGRRDELWGGANPLASRWRSRACLALAAMGDSVGARRRARDDLWRARRWGAASGVGVALRATALVEGDAGSVGRLREAVAVLEGSPARLEHARALTDLGAAMRRGNRRAEARGALQDGLDLAERCGAHALAERARTELRAAGGRPSQLLGAGAQQLTVSERRVAELAAEGRSNPEIAQVLFVTRKTVETHLGHVYHKLGVPGRGQLGRALAEQTPTASG